jgi:hypothetical protein
MIYVFVYPVEGFDRNIADDRLKEACLNETGVERYTLEAFINALNDDVLNLDTHWARVIEDNHGRYPVSFLNIDDLESSGFDVSEVTESDLYSLVNKLNKDYREWHYWQSLKIIADHLGIPRLNLDNQST